MTNRLIAVFCACLPTKAIDGGVYAGEGKIAVAYIIPALRS